MSDWGQYSAMTYVDAFDNESGLLTGVGLLAALPLLVVGMWTLERADLAVAGTDVDPTGGVVGVVATTFALVVLLAVALVAVHNLER